MVNSTLTLPETAHPNKDANRDYHLLVGIDEHKVALLKTLQMLLDRKTITTWEKKFHAKGLTIMGHLKTGSPLIILSGEVGCGKTHLAQSVATPLAEILKAPVKVFETPSNIRGGGLVGEISSRITSIFQAAKDGLADNENGILIIDEADDLATSRSQNAAHHEDRAGVNVLIKQIDGIKRDNKNLAVIMITNRISVLDPAVRRRTSLNLIFERPAGDKLRDILAHLLAGTAYSPKELERLVKMAESHKNPYSYSDLIHRVGLQALYEAVETNQAFGVDLLSRSLENTQPTPLLEDDKTS